MDLWHENQGQSPLQTKFGTVSGRNYTQNYHDRYQATHYPLQYGELQDHGRESRYLTLPGSRTGGAPQKYTNWMDQELTVPASSHLSFIVDCHPQQHHVFGEYQPKEARNKEWTAAKQAGREYESGSLREGWQRRWEACSPVRCNREVSTTLKSDNSYRELEAWAARYSHSLPRRRRIEAEFRDSSQGMLESSRPPERDSMSGADPRGVMLQQVIQSANIREARLWDRGARQQAPNHYPQQIPATGKSHIMDIQEKMGYERRIFSQPPGYIAPPPYKNPNDVPQLLQHRDTSWEQVGKRQTYRTQPTLRKQDVTADHSEGGKEFTKPEATQYNFPEDERLKLQKQETDVLKTSIPIGVEKQHVQHDCRLSLQLPQVLKTAPNEPAPKVIEGRKFRLNKKSGEMTIFCLVSRIAGPTESPSLSFCSLQTSKQNMDIGGVPKGLTQSSDRSPTQNLADEVDLGAQTLREHSSISNVKDPKVKHKDTPTCREREQLNKAETLDISPGKACNSDVDSIIDKEVYQSVQPVSVKYPLWREPGSAETESSSISLKGNTGGGESDILQHQDVSVEVRPTDNEEKSLDIKTDTKSENSKNLPLIDTACVVVKMELISLPNKKQVHYFNSTHNLEYSPADIESNVSPECVKLNYQLTQDVTTDQDAERDPVHNLEIPETKLDSDHGERKTTVPFPCMSSSSVSETLEQRAERILGIPLHDCIIQQKPSDQTPLLNVCVEDQIINSSLMKYNVTDISPLETPEDTTNDKQTQVQLEVDQTECLKDPKHQGSSAGYEDIAVSQMSIVSEENDVIPHLRTDTNASPETEITKDSDIESNGEEDKTEKSCDEKPAFENEHQHPSKCLSPLTDLSNSVPPPPSTNCNGLDPTFAFKPTSSNISESTIREGPDSELIVPDSLKHLSLYHVTETVPQTPEQRSSALPPESTNLSQSSSPHPDPTPTDVANQTADAGSIDEDLEDKCETSQLTKNEISDALNKFSEYVTEKIVSQKQFQSALPDNAAFAKDRGVTDEQQTEEANEDPIDYCTLQILKKSQENDPEFSILHQLEYAQRDLACETENSKAKEQLPDEATEDLTVFLKPAIFQENITERKIGQEEHASCVKEIYMTEESSNKAACQEPMGLFEQAMLRENVRETPAQMGMHSPLESKPSNSYPPSTSDSNCKISQSLLDVLSPSEPHPLPHLSHKSDIELAPPLQIESVSLSGLNPVCDAALLARTPEMAPTTLPPDSWDDSFKFSSCSNSPQVLPPSFTTPGLQEGRRCVSPNLSKKEETQYPKSLWDVVNRIRKHTAPDSESEDEEMSEQWDPESLGGGLGCTGVVEDMDFEKRAFDESERQKDPAEGIVDDNVEVVNDQMDLCYEEQSRCAEEGLTSCSSTSSHCSEDTVFLADDDEETPPSDGTDTESVHDEQSKTEKEEEQYCCGEVKDEATSKQTDVLLVTDEYSQSEAFRDLNTTDKTVGMMQTKQKQNEGGEVSMSDERMTESMPIK